MKETFGTALRSFANSIDILREEEFRLVLSATQNYLRGNFRITTVERLSEVVSEGIPKLAPTFGDNPYDLFPVRTDGGPNGISAMAFTSKRSMWVTPADGSGSSIVNAGSRICERWEPGHSVTLPSYLPLAKKVGTRVGTLISIPIERQGSVTAVVYFESERVLEPSGRAKDELEAIAKSLAWLYELKVHDLDTRSATAREIAELQDVSMNDYDWRPRPSLFWAYPGSGADDVRGVVDAALQVLVAEGAFTLDDWSDNQSGGRIPAQIEQQIRSAEYFVAYLSEPASAHATNASASAQTSASSSASDSTSPAFAQPESPDATVYVDNPNVLYEAGVFQGLGAQTSRSENWLLIREENAPDPPFDLGTVNTLLVPREDGQLLSEEFETRVNDRIENLFGRRPETSDRSSG